MPIDLSRKPYFDDYDESKNFYKILYRPGYAVQARELNQTQSIIQKQIDRLGSSIYKNGSVVVPGGFAVDTEFSYVKIILPGAFSEANLDSLIGLEAVSGSTKAKIVAAEPSNLTDPTTIFVRYTQGTAFAPNATVTIDGSTVVTVEAGADAVGSGSALLIKDGIYFVNGWFVVSSDEIYILDKYSNTPSYEVGFAYTETIVKPEEDESLFENAEGSPNFNAPGAHRLKIELVPTKRLLGDQTVDTNFVKLVTVDEGVIQQEFRNPQYSVLADELARRTFNESGDYVIDPFVIKLREHLNDGSNDGAFLPEDGGVSDKFAAIFDPGLAYVNGYEVSTISNTVVSVDKARSTRTVQNGITGLRVGNYIQVTNINNLPEISGQPKINLRDDSLNVIGTARIRHVAFDNGTTYRLYIFNIEMDPGLSFDSDVSSVSQTIAGGTFTATTVKVGGLNVLYDVTNKVNVFKLPYSTISTVTGPGNVVDTSYTIVKEFTGLVGSNINSPSGVFTVGAQFVSTSNEPFSPDFTSYLLVNLTTGFVYSLSSSAFVTDGTGSTLYVNLTGQPSTTNPLISQDNLRIVTHNVVSIGPPKTKNLVSSYTKTVAPGYSDNIKLDHADGYQLVSVIEDQSGTPVNITSRYVFDNGQRDEYYDIASVVRQAATVAPAGQLSITYSYFNHVGSSDYFCVDSYAIPYEDIPSYTGSDGTVYRLADSYDFRPRINSAGTDFTGSGSSASRQFVPYSPIISDFSYYLSRIDRICLDKNGSFQVIQGVSAEVPEAPPVLAGSITLNILKIPAYTFSVSDVTVKTENYKRYTMRDIGNLETRIKNLEYYVSLSLLEQQTQNLVILDSAGLDKFKNGFVVDNFSSQEVAAIGDSAYKASIDFEEQAVRPEGLGSYVDFAPVKSAAQLVSDGIKLHDDGIITLNYSEVEELKQNLASTSIAVNPYSVFFFPGTLDIDPSVDYWFTTSEAFDIVSNEESQVNGDYASRCLKDGRFVEWGGWLSSWFGRIPKNTYIGALGSRLLLDASDNTLSARKATVKQNEKESTFVVKNTDNRSLSTSSIPYIRSKTIKAKAKGLRPNATHYFFFDGVNLTANCNPSVLVTDADGKVDFTFTIPNTDAVKFATGAKTILLTDAATVNKNMATSYANATYTAMGITGKDENSTTTPVPCSTVRYETVSETVNTCEQFTWGSSIREIITFTPAIVSSRFGYTDTAGFVSVKYKSTTGFVSHFVGYSLTLTITDSSGVRNFTLPGNFHRPTDVMGMNEYSYSVAAGPYSIILTRGATSLGLYSHVITGYICAPQTTKTTKIVRVVDPVAQSFAVDSTGGVYATSVDVYFAAKDSNIPVTLDLREMSNGFPTKNVLAGGTVTLAASQVNVSETGTLATRFKFTSPVFLKEGVEYCFVVLSNSDVYKVFIATVAQTDLITKQSITKQPSVGVMFKSQNDSTWTEDQMSDVKFVLNRASFTSSAGSVEFKPEVGQFEALTDSNVFLVKLGINPITTVSGSNTVTVNQIGHGFNSGDTATLSGFDQSIHGIPFAEVNGSHVVTVIDTDKYTINVSTNATLSGQDGGENGRSSKVVSYDLYHVNSSSVSTDGTAISWNIANKVYSAGANGSVRDGYVGVVPGTDVVAPRTYHIVPSSASNTAISATLVSSAENLSPVVYSRSVGLMGIRNRINDNVNDPAAAYITKPVQLATPARSVKVMADVNRPANTSLRVYVRAKTVDDLTPFDQIPYTEMTVTGALPQANTNLDGFNEYEYDITLPSQFDTFSVKVVMLSSDTTRVPRISQFRAIATAS